MQRFKRISKRTLAVLLSVLMITLIVTSASAATATPSGKNTASRSTNATALSTQATAYYTDEVKQFITGSTVYGTFQSLANDNPSNSSTDSWEATQNNALYDTLYNIMSSTQTHGVSYSGTSSNSLARYWLTTDTSDKDTGDNSYTFFYSDVTCSGHTKMQREHIWPKSHASFHMKTGLGGSDLHHLRPAYGTVNNIKSNWGFADLHNSDGTFKSGCTNTRTVEWPAGSTALWRAEYGGTTFIDVKNDVRGDIARILLYVYTRWKQPNLFSDVSENHLPAFDDDDSKNDGQKIIYNLDTLLNWMAQDPVSQWEMERNDLTEDIQGNRNVFIDYPELAWLLFDKQSEVPSNMDTPSGMAKQTGTDSNRENDPDNAVTLDFSITGSSKGVATITAYDNADHKFVKNGDKVERGHSITYTVNPEESIITFIRDYKDATHNTQIFSSDDRDTEYEFTIDAGANNNDNYNIEKITVALASKVCILNYNISGKTATGASKGKGSGMVTARYMDSNNVIHKVENGGSVPNGTCVTLTFIPDYGSSFHEITTGTSTEIPTPTQVTGTNSFETTVRLDCSDNTVRKKSFTVYFKQTYEVGTTNYIKNTGLSPDKADPWGEAMGFTTNFEICGVQVKQSKDANNKALRFISVIDKNILSKAKEYGYVISYTNHSDTLSSQFINSNAYTLTRNGAYGVTLDCTGTDNDYFGDYGKHDTNKNYKYITAAVNNIQDGGEIGENTTIIARPYVVLNDDSVVYGQYMDVNTGETYCACSGSYSYISSLIS